MVLLLLAVLVEPLAERIRIPFSAALVFIGFVGSEVLIGAGFDTGVRWENFRDLIYYVFLPVLIFEAAFRLDFRALLKDLFIILMLSLPLMALGAAITAVIVYYGIAHPSGFPWVAALLTGALLSATDPASVLSLLKKIKATERINILLEGESLFNDATAIVLFSLLVTLALGFGEAKAWDKALGEFLLIFFGGLAVGALIGSLTYALMGAFRQPVIAGLMTVLCAYFAYLIADVLQISGVMAVLAAGLVLGELARRSGESRESRFVEDLWEFAGYVANALIFLLAGVTITVVMFQSQWLAMLIGICAVLIARAALVFGFLGPMSRLPGVKAIPMSHQVVLTWGGVRGAVTLALALSLPLELDFWFTIQSIAYGVVLFTLFVQTTTMRWVIRKLLF
ncbi:MAG: sodium:proton antiporter [Gammaproteobacteria bacterium]|nr:sodium:proton antiporter [Gammaproteobacteria bacterium]